MDISQHTIVVRRIPGARHLRLRLLRGGRLQVSVPPRATAQMIREFVAEQRDWIAQQYESLQSRDSIMMTVHDDVTRARLVSDARELVHWRLEHFNKFYKFQYNRVAIRNQSTRWGSCSSGRNLNFNYRIVLLDPELQDYLVVHELCHLAEMNHGPRFWELVSHTIPNYRTLSKQLRADDHVGSD